jgi:hypothetical protein
MRKDVSNWAKKHCKAMVHKYTAKENQSLFNMARKDGARTRRTAGVKCVVEAYEIQTEAEA